VGDTLTFGFVGAGEIAVESAAAVRDAPSASLAAVFDVDPALAADLAGRHDARTATTLDALVADDGVDAVYVCVPHVFHREMALRAAAAGKHVFVEKPMGVSVADARAIVEGCAERRVACGVAFVARWAPAYARAHELVASGAIGEVTGFRITYRGDKPASYWTGGWSGRASGDWRMHWESAGGGVLLMNTIHDLDAVLWLAGLDVVRVQGAIATTSGPGEVEDVGLAVLQASNGALGSIEALAAVPGGDAPGARWINRVYGTEGQVLLPTPWGEDGLAVFRRGDGWSELGREQALGARASAFEAFAAGVLAGVEPPVPGRDGVRASALVHAIYEAARIHRPVDVRGPDA
jgi:UDP-N-acetyl-2-amino-2-deoxyglucuronate dehydrogenase